jgi:hypothetical protein
MANTRKRRSFLQSYHRSVTLTEDAKRTFKVWLLGVASWPAVQYLVIPALQAHGS